MNTQARAAEGSAVRAGEAGARSWVSEFLHSSAGDWGISSAWIAFLQVLPAVMLLSGAVAALMGKNAYKWFMQEDGFAEWMTVVFYVPALFLSIAVLRNLWRRREKPFALLYMLLTIAFVFMIGEELSWGQRAIGWQTPSAFGVMNKQDETNLHNIYGVGSTFKVVQMLVGAYGVVLPLLVFGWARLAKYRRELAMVVPPYSLLLYFLPMFVWRFYRVVFPEPPHRFYFVISEYNEVVEMALACGFALFCLYQLRRLRRQPTGIPATGAARRSSSLSWT